MADLNEVYAAATEETALEKPEEVYHKSPLSRRVSSVLP